MKIEFLIKNLKNPDLETKVVSLEVHSGGCVIGRHAKDLRLSDPKVSAHHLFLYSQDGCLNVTDSSRNGTFLDSRQITSAVISIGSSLRVGDTLLTLLNIQLEEQTNTPMSQADFLPVKESDLEIVAGWPGHWVAIPKPKQIEFKKYLNK